MSYDSAPLQPKIPGSALRVLIIGRISTEHQDEENIQASYRYVESYLARLYDGTLEIRHLGERASGMLVDRETIREAEDLIATGDWDLAIAEDLSRIFRNPRHQYNFVQDAVDSDTRVVCIADNLDTADENWEIMLGAATLRHGMTVPDVRRRVRRTATHAFHRGGMVLKVKYGYRKLTEEEASSGHFGPPGLRIAKRPECTPIIREMKNRVLRGDHYAAIAEWLRNEGIESPPYASQWTAKLVKLLLSDPILSGTRRFRQVIHRPVYRTGKHRRVPNAAPEQEHYPELAHFSTEEHEELLSVMGERERHHRHKSGREHPLMGRPRRRAIWPAQHAVCGICRGLLYQTGKSMKCQNALAGSTSPCWNRVQLQTSLARNKVLQALLCEAKRSAALHRLLIDAVNDELKRKDRSSHQATHALEQKIAERQRQIDNLTGAIAAGGQMGPLLERLKVVESELQTLRRQQRQQQKAEREDSNSEQSPMEESLDSLLLSVAASSFTFADFLRTLVPQFLVQPVQALDTNQVRPRALLTIRLPHDAQDQATNGQDWQIVVDLFDPPLHIRHLEACRCAKRETPRASLKAIASRLDLNHMTVKRAVDYRRKMERNGLSDPYQLLSEPPVSASRWKDR